MSIFSENVFLVYLGVAFTAAIFISNDQCLPNEEYLTCGPLCPPTCSNPDANATCEETCAEGCFCVSGYLKDENNTCVTPDQCTDNSTTIIETNSICGINEEFRECGTSCPLTCSKPEPRTCHLACSRGCFCKVGYYRDEATDQCVTQDKCSTAPCLNQNEVYDICNKSCEPSCLDPEPICTKDCTGGCICAPGLLRNADGECVTVDKCPHNTTNPGPLEKYLKTINSILHLSAKV